MSAAAMVPCPAPGFTFAGVHLETLPSSQTAPLLYCATCLGFREIPANELARIPRPSMVATS